MKTTMNVRDLVLESILTYKKYSKKLTRADVFLKQANSCIGSLLNILVKIPEGTKIEFIHDETSIDFSRNICNIINVSGKILNFDLKLLLHELNQLRRIVDNLEREFQYEVHA